MTDHMSARVKKGIDTDLVRPDNNLECTEKCPSMVKDRCLVIGYHKTTVEAEKASGNSYTKADHCVPVFDEIHRLYGEDRKRRKQKDDTCVRHIECVVVAKGLGKHDTFDEEMTRLLSEGWQREGRFRTENVDSNLVGVQMLTRTHYVPVVKDDEKECDKHDFKPSSDHRGKYVCTACECFGVRLSRDQRQRDDVLVISVKEYEERFLP